MNGKKANPVLPNREDFLREYEVGISPIDKDKVTAQEGALELSILGIKSIFILNGGAFIAIPALSHTFQISTANMKAHLISAACAFSIGLISAMATNIIAYFSQSKYAEQLYWHREVAIHQNVSLYYGQVNDAEKLASILDNAVKKRDSCYNSSQNQRNTAIGFAIASALMFVLGAGTLLYCTL
jgi:hypothetical protein